MFCFSELEGCILSWKEAAETIRNNYHSENYLQFAPASNSGKPVHFCVEFMEEKLVRGSGEFMKKISVRAMSKYPVTWKRRVH